MTFSGEERRKTGPRGWHPVWKLRRAWWHLRVECKGFAFWFLAAIPVGLGVWLRALCMPYFFRELGRNTVLQSGLRVSNPEKVSIGSNCNFAQGVFITGGGGVRIGDWVGFGPDVKVWSVNHRFDDPERPWLLQGWDKKPVVIEDDVWLGANVFVMPGVTIGRGAIVSAASVVNKSVPPFALVAGNPGRVVGWRKRPASDPDQGAVQQIIGGEHDRQTKTKCGVATNDDGLRTGEASAEIES